MCSELVLLLGDAVVLGSIPHHHLLGIGTIWLLAWFFVDNIFALYFSFNVWWHGYSNDGTLFESVGGLLVILQGLHWTGLYCWSLPRRHRCHNRCDENWSNCWSRMPRNCREHWSMHDWIGWASWLLWVLSWWSWQGHICCCTFVDYLGGSTRIRRSIMVLDRAQAFGVIYCILYVIDAWTLSAGLFLIISVSFLASSDEWRTGTLPAAAVTYHVLIKWSLILWRQVLVEAQVLLLDQFHFICAVLFQFRNYFVMALLGECDTQSILQTQLRQKLLIL